jgi:NB-ARC domain
MSERYTFSELLRQFLARADINYQELGEKLGAFLRSDAVHRNTVGAWVRGDSYPRTRRMVLALAAVLHLTDEEQEQLLAAHLGHLSAAPEENALSSSPAPLPYWNVPQHRNPFFTGREEILKRLHDTLTSDRTAALTQPQAISGLGGIGKTQTAVEYAYRYHDEYQAILWVKADSREILTSDFISLAKVLNLPEWEEQDPGRTIMAIKRWLQDQAGWLLILDNIEDLETLNELLPTTGRGHILLTTRTQATGGIARRVEIEKMEPDEGALFLLRRAKFILPDTPLDQTPSSIRNQARRVSEVLDGLPLALDQAGAYVEETRCGLSHYLDLYQVRRDELLRRRGTPLFDHPESVATTFSLSFQKMQQTNAAAAELLLLCAFLYPDAIPEEMITAGAPDLGPLLQAVVSSPLKFDEALAELLNYSLIRRDAAAGMLSIHRLCPSTLIMTAKSWF